MKKYIRQFAILFAIILISNCGYSQETVTRIRTDSFSLQIGNKVNNESKWSKPSDWEYRNDLFVITDENITLYRDNLKYSFEIIHVIDPSSYSNSLVVSGNLAVDSKGRVCTIEVETIEEKKQIFITIASPTLKMRYLLRTN